MLDHIDELIAGGVLAGEVAACGRLRGRLEPRARSTTVARACAPSCGAGPPDALLERGAA